MCYLDDVVVFGRDFNGHYKNFVLQTDASDCGVGAVLSQLDDSGNEKVIAYASKALSPREQKYSTTEKYSKKRLLSCLAQATFAYTS